MPTEVAYPEKLDSRTFDELLQAQDPFQKSPCLFDLSGIRFISPSALVQLAAACYALKKAKKQPTILLDDFSVGTYLARAGFISVVEPVAKIEPSYLTSIHLDHLRGSNEMLIEVTRIESGAALPDLLDQIVAVLLSRFKYRKEDAFDVAIAVSEICQNTFDHNEETCGFLAMQVYGQGARRFLEIGVSDHGGGLAETLRRNPKNPKITSDFEAIKQATTLLTSEYDDPTRGTGLHHLLEIAYKLQGSVQIRSGSAKVRYRMDKQKGWLIPVSNMPGVHIAVTLGSGKK